jgi:hypothetical protein
MTNEQRAVRNRAIVQAYNDGMRLIDIAIANNLCGTAVASIIGKARRDDPDSVTRARHTMPSGDARAVPRREMSDDGPELVAQLEAVLAEAEARAFELSCALEYAKAGDVPGALLWMRGVDPEVGRAFVGSEVA